MVIECVVTSRDEEGTVNFAAIGVGWGEEVMTLRPFINTRTYRNLVNTGQAVVNVTDNVLIFAKSALSRETFDAMPAERVRGVILRDSCHWREVQVERVVPAIGETAPGRAEIIARVVSGGVIRPFAGLCRAKHAVVEASIIASRLRLAPPEDVVHELHRLDVLVDKTGGEQEREAMAFIRAYVARRGVKI